MSRVSRKKKEKKRNSESKRLQGPYSARHFEFLGDCWPLDGTLLSQVFLEKFPESDHKQLSKLILELSNLGCVDNLRICAKGDKEGERLYDAAVKRGCCGFEDREVHMPSGLTYRVGVNFGH